MEFEWDEDKDEANLMKHGLSFAEASSVFNDPEALEERDDREYGSEVRLWGCRSGRWSGVVCEFYNERTEGADYLREKGEPL